ncbi:transcription factor Tfb2 [Lophium mytilinum]|uniref:RNA polymerase II transcription factor B subunit 2 n=1 Tax=Lophium mytilinum TaxID=390894 RepID=A0A6A6R6T4_9PEZI|nr:transcription factor Tfb2 [Lophium mytilinum]
MSASTSQALDYLEGQTQITHQKLYEQPSTALAVFRCMLPHLAKTIVMAMLYMPRAFTIGDLDHWIRANSKGEREKAISVLQSLHIITHSQESSKSLSYRLESGFANSLRQALTGGGNHKSFGVPSSTPDKNDVDIAFLDQFARKQWEAILYFMVGSTSGLRDSTGLGETVGNGTRKLLEIGDFVTRANHGTITKTGFTFLLQEANAQVWSLLIVYLKQAPELGMNEVDVLSFIFMLGSLSLGQDYSTATLSPTQLQMLEDLNDFGIVYRSSKTSSRFYPTRLATTLTSDAGALQTTSTTFSNALRPSTAPGKGYIIVETNYRIYAYTSSHLQIAVLSLFARLSSRFPNLVSGKLTKDSIQRAIKLGIEARQIIDYLTAHAHPQMQKNNPVLPPTVMDQIRLWEYEGERIEATHGHLMKDFSSEKEYQDTLGYAESLGVLTWKSDQKRVFFVDRLEQISAYLVSKKEKR